MSALDRPAGRIRKLMLYSHDTYGLGHLRRNLRIASHLLAAAGDLRITLVTGSPVAGHFPVPRGLTVIKLPSVRKVGAERYQPIDSGIGIDLIRRTRTAIMCDAARRFRPDALLVDHSPAGMNGELLGVFETIRARLPRTRIVLGLRDILDEPDVVIRTWTEQDIYEIIDQAYDQVVVYGCQDLFDVAASYRLSGRLSAQLTYCGYLRPAGSGQVADRGADAAGPDGAAPYLLATAGGGGDGMAALTGAMEAGQALGMPVIAVTGPLIDDRGWSELESAAARARNIELVRFHPDLLGAMAAAAVIVTMGGYNSMCEAVATGVPAVAVPRVQPRLEQAIRARRFAERGLVRVVEPGPDLGRRIAEAARDSLLAPRASPAPARVPLDFGGLDRLARILLTDPAPERDRTPARLTSRPPATRQFAGQAGDRA